MKGLTWPDWCHTSHKAAKSTGWRWWLQQLPGCDTSRASSKGRLKSQPAPHPGASPQLLWSVLFLVKDGRTQQAGKPSSSE